VCRCSVGVRVCVGAVLANFWWGFLYFLSCRPTRNGLKSPKLLVSDNGFVLMIQPFLTLSADFYSNSRWDDGSKWSSLH
jgi:hypothetical protein